MLIDDARDLSNRLVKAETARETIDETTSLQELANELEGFQLKIQAALQRSQTLRSAGISVTNAEGADTLIKTIAGVLKAFDLDRRSGTLKRGSRWSKLVTSLNEYIQSTETRRLENWKHYFSNALFAGDPPEALQTRLAPTPENNRQLTKYRQLYARFNRYRSALPFSQEEISEIKAWSQELAEVEKAFETNLPDAVRDFFSATASNTGAPLRLFNKEVEAWLIEHKLLDSYFVRARYQ